MTVDVVLLTVRAGRLAVLLVERKGHPFRGQWALPGGFVEPDEDLDDARPARARRRRPACAIATADDAARARAPRTAAHLRHARTAIRGCAWFRSRTSGSPRRGEIVAGSDAADARFWTIDDLAIDGIGSADGIPLAFDHARVIADGVERARAKLEYTTLATAFLDEPFTLGDLRRVYEAVWAEPLHEGNFRRKVLSTPGLRRTHRPDRAHRRATRRAVPARRRAATAPADPPRVIAMIGVYPGIVRPADDRARRDRGGRGATGAASNASTSRLSRVALGKEDRADVEAAGSARSNAWSRTAPELGVVVTDAQLIADIAARLRRRRDGRRQVGAGERSGVVSRRRPTRDAALARAAARARRAAARLRHRAAPRSLELDADHGEVSSTAARARRSTTT